MATFNEFGKKLMVSRYVDTCSISVLNAVIDAEEESLPDNGDELASRKRQKRKRDTEEVNGLDDLGDLERL